MFVLDGESFLKRCFWTTPESRLIVFFEHGNGEHIPFYFLAGKVLVGYSELYRQIFSIPAEGKIFYPDLFLLDAGLFKRGDSSSVLEGFPASSSAGFRSCAFLFLSVVSGRFLNALILRSRFGYASVLCIYRLYLKADAAVFPQALSEGCLCAMNPRTGKDTANKPKTKSTKKRMEPNNNLEEIRKLLTFPGPLEIMTVK